MKVIFLDIDGVLNNLYQYETFIDQMLETKEYTQPHIPFDINNLKRLKRLVDETGSEIVLSTNRRGNPQFLEIIDQVFKEYLGKTFFDKTELTGE